MCAQTISELVVKVSPKGVEDTTDSLERQQEAFEETAQTAEEEGGKLDKFAKRWQGAMQAIVVGLGVAAAGLLSQVPVVGETMGALEAIIDAVALKLDDKLRPSLGKFNRELFDIANDLAASEGDFDDFIDTIGRMGFAWDSIVPLSPLRLAVRLRLALRDLKEWGDDIVTEGRQSWDNFKQAVKRKVDQTIQDVYVRFNRFRTGIVARLRTASADAIEAVSEWFTNKRKLISDKWDEIRTDAMNAGKGIVNDLISGLRSRLSSLRSMANRVAAAVRNRLPGSDARTGPLSDLSQTGPALVDTLASGMERNTGRLTRATGRVASAADPRGQASGSGMGGGNNAVLRQLESLVQSMSNNRIEVPVNLDSREIARGVEPLIASGALNVGATGVRR